MNETAQARMTTLVFDWGDTVMQTNPRYSGAMVDWPEVRAVSGIQQALSSLDGKFQVVMATNAVDSSADQIRSALARVGLDPFFPQIFTYHELRARKPTITFFRTIEEIIQLSASQLVMIGDDYRADMLGAHASGWQTLWYNPLCQPCPGMIPLHTGEIKEMSQLLSALTSLALPEFEECRHWLIEENTPANLWLHVQGVAAAAYQMALWLRAAGKTVDPVLAHRGGLLHDVAKLRAHQNHNAGGHHGEQAYSLLMARGQETLALIARRHMMFNILDPLDSPATWEEKLVFFADKLIEGSTLVELDVRLAALRQRYPSNADQLTAVIPALRSLQAELAKAMGFPSDELVPRLRQAFNGE